MITKRLLDLIGALLGLALLWPLLAIAAIGIRLSSPGPVLHRARRAGRYGVPFEMLKLRTMHVAAEGPRVTATDDPRIFPFGAFLRRTKIDELPQLINILRGEMSIIGPRPEDPHFVETAYSIREWGTLIVRPGLSSPGSLYHDRCCSEILRVADPDAVYRESLLPRKLALDLEYVQRASLVEDLRVIGRTLSHLAHELAPARSRRTTAALLAISLIACTDAIDAPRPGWLYDPDEVILVGAADIAACGQEADDATAAILDQIVGTVFTAGDNAYPSGTLEQFQQCYGPTWGRHLERTRPAPGNHEYDTPAAAGYFEYFGDRAGEPGKGYYSYDLASWHVVVLNSEIPIGPGSAQLDWLEQDLDANAGACVIAYWHRPRFNSGAEHGDDPGLTGAWELLYAAGTEVVINGHEHIYERFDPQTPDGVADPALGIRQFTVGTGGREEYGIGAPRPNSVVRQTGIPGVLALRLLPGAYEWLFIAIDGATFADSGHGTCHGAPSATSEGAR
jgi:lipopolysaccharide/colanic/teichoic acid biosynthesis glycosyltransferase